ncbi:50S ribosomal protein L18 [Candidatus Bathyarchaeota archaeon RBG_16_57_9]|nr:50S ribosomal protein L18, large subunit ribosomal protein L18 [uncultured archaeon]AJS13086.1 50S ribosomal protein L18, large subunit ribosomal protein L18 [uncultured archaeon]OGD45205.1 MAG: 50S ribosomal protein L18 [Candidatus Bathyarchaeota archaeon RBG_16_57_9]OGD54108.1 MAG: 50S ribosomal protein L18 [Candidatus Bathyarchaeota archaeon RBG_13_60_20]
MVKGPRYRVKYRRRRENKTDYVLRRALATAEAPRFVVRVSNKGILVQVTNAEIEGDYVVAQAASRELKQYGWKASGKNTPAAYLVGYLAGRKALEAGVARANLDMGLNRSTTGNKAFAVAKGAMDAGLEIPCDSDIMPSPERMNGGAVAEYAENMADPLEYEKRFSIYLRRGLRPEELPAHFEEVKARIEERSVE